MTDEATLYWCDPERNTQCRFVTYANTIETTIEIRFPKNVPIAKSPIYHVSHVSTYQKNALSARFTSVVSPPKNRYSNPSRCFR